MNETEPCTECEAQRRKAIIIGIGSGVLLGAGLILAFNLYKAR
jgi:hypothetical protein